MDTYELLANSLLQYLDEQEYAKTITQSYHRWLTQLGDYLLDQGAGYSPELALEWLEKAHITSKNIFAAKLMLKRLQDIAEIGEVRKENGKPLYLPDYIISDEFKQHIDNFLIMISKSKSEKNVKKYQICCTKFFAFAQRHGSKSVCDINPKLLCDFLDSDMCNKAISPGCVSTMMTYLYEQGLVPYSCTIIIHYLTIGKLKDCFWNEVSKEGHLKISNLMSLTHTVDIETLIKYRDFLINLKKENNYSKSDTLSSLNAVNYLILFLEMNGYSYCPEISRIWFDEIHHVLEWSKYHVVRRTLLLIEEYHKTSNITLDKMICIAPNKFSQLPLWCKSIATQYVEQKINEGWEKSTLDMIRSSITRFCTFLDNEGVSSFYDVDASLIKKFNETDLHKTPQGKNAYNTRIRKFLIYLSEQHLLKEPMLFVALKCVSAPKESIVVVLTEEEMAELTEYIHKDDISLREKAILLLGLKMGIRSSDIVNLSVSNIDWTNASIRFVQKKTAVEVNLPMPIEVGNALFQYITEERGINSTPNVFLSKKAPRASVGRSVCSGALLNSLPKRKVEGSGFHVLRKTYATTLLKNGVGANTVVEALGHRSSVSVHRYLALDADRMRMCPISLSKYGVGGWADEI